jgi:MFS transporter, UMF1 family
VAPRPVVRAWLLYDAANSAFVTTVVTALGGPFLTALAESAADDSGRVSLLGLSPRSGSVYAYVTSLSVLLQVVALPLLGAVADRARGKHRLLAGGTAVGVMATVLFAVAPTWQLAALALLVANVAYGAAIVAYNAMLADVAEEPDRDRVSSQGFAVGYVGGGLLLALSLVGLALAPSLGVGKGTVVRVSVAAAAVWWAVLGLYCLRRLAVLHAGAAVAPRGRFRGDLAASWSQLREVGRELRRLPLTARYLLSFLLFNDAVQAVIALSSVFLTQELYVTKGRSADDATGFLLALVLLIQFVAVAGALGFARLARRTGAKRAILISLVGWVLIVTYAYAALRTQAQAWALGVAIALVLGGSQALARSLFSRMIPAGHQSGFFAFYELAERGTAWIGTLTFGIVLDITGSYRLALLSLLVLFVSGGALLATTDTDAAEVAASRAPAPA